MNANVGMVYPVAAPVSAYTPGTSISYGTGFVVSEAVSASLSWNRADGRFYGDDVELDSDNGVLGYTLSFEPAGLSATNRQKLLGELVATDEYTITDAASPDVGFGYIRVMRTKGTSTVTTSYEAWWFQKLKFSVFQPETKRRATCSPTFRADSCRSSALPTMSLAFPLKRCTLSLPMLSYTDREVLSGTLISAGFSGSSSCEDSRKMTSPSVSITSACICSTVTESV